MNAAGIAHGPERSGLPPKLGTPRNRRGDFQMSSLRPGPTLEMNEWSNVREGGTPSRLYWPRRASCRLGLYREVLASSNHSSHPFEKKSADIQSSRQLHTHRSQYPRMFSWPSVVKDGWKHGDDKRTMALGDETLSIK
jgi:hypothetical protein